MRYVAGLLYGVAVAAGSGKLLDVVMTGLAVCIGTIALVFAIEAIVDERLPRQR